MLGSTTWGEVYGVSISIVKVAMGCRTEPAIVHIAYVFHKLHFPPPTFPIFFIISTTYHKIHYTILPQKMDFFLKSLHDLLQYKSQN